MIDIEQHIDINEPRRAPGLGGVGIVWGDPPQPEPSRSDQADRNQRGISDPATSADPPPTGPSEAQQAANRANAQKSTGPKTSEGKKRSRSNATTHGGYATRLTSLLNGPYAEDPGDVEDFVAAVISALDPQDALQQALAEQIACACIRQRRVTGWQHGLLEAASNDEHSTLTEREAQARVAMRSLKLIEQEGRLRSQLGREQIQLLGMFAKLKKTDEPSQ